MEKRRGEDGPALTGAKKLKTDSSQMLKTLHDHLDMVAEEVELRENQLQVLSSKLVEIQKQIEQQTDKLKSTEVEARDKEKALGLIKNMIKSEEETLIELRTSLEHTGNELELKKTELKKTANELERKKTENELELKKTGNELELKKTELKNVGNELELQKTELKNTGNELELKKAELKNTGNELDFKKTELKSTGNELELKKTELKSTGNELELKKTELKSTGNELELKKAELKKTGNELELKKEELKKTELKNTELRLRSSVFVVKHEPQPIAAEPELSTGDASLLHELSSVALERNKVYSYLRVISNPAKFVLDLVDRQLKTAYRRQKLGLQDLVLKNLVLFLEELAEIGGSEKLQLQFKAKELASTWKEIITIEAPRSSREALAFLLFIVAFGLNSLINEEETALLASSVFHHTQSAELFKFFGFNLEIPELVRDLIKDRQYIPAARIICSLNLANFSATTLLMKEITVLRHSAMEKVKNKDVGRLRAVVELVADYKLDIDLPGELIAKLMFLRENSTPPELHCSVEVAEATSSGVNLLVPKHETKPFVNPFTNCSC